MMRKLIALMAMGVMLVGMTPSVLAQGNKLTSAAKYIDDGLYDKAYEALDEASRHEKTAENSRTYYQMAQLFMAVYLDTTGKWTTLSADPLADARTSLQKTLKYDSKKAMKSRAVPKADQVARLLYNAGLTSYRAGNYNEAYRSFRGSYQSYGIIVGYGAAEGRDTSTYYFASICADLAGNKDTAETMYRNLIAWNYDEPGIYGNLAKLYLAQDKLEEAERVFAEGRSKFPGNQELLIDELNYFLGQGRAPEAIDKFELAIANDPNNPELYFAMGTAFQALIKLDSANAQQHMADARKAYGKSIELNPKSFDAYLNTGALFYNEGVLIQQKLDAVDINDLAAAKALENERNKLYGEALPFFQQAARVYEEMPEEEKIDLFFAIEVYRSLKEINVRLGDYEASGKAKKRMEELQAQRDAAGE